MAKKPKNAKSGSRMVTTHVKSARGRTTSSVRWLQRQLNDPYVAKAQKEGYRSRAAFKLLELQEKYKLIRPGDNVVDLGCAPGGWLQVAAEIAGGTTTIIGIDLKEIEQIAGTRSFVLDFNDNDAPEILIKELGGKRANLVMSDMAANTTGHAATDHIRIIALCELAYDFARQVLAPGGHFICKVIKGGTEGELLTLMKRDFETVKHAKPKASRADSAESYVVALGFRGAN